MSNTQPLVGMQISIKPNNVMVTIFALNLMTDSSPYFAKKAIYL